MPDAKIFCWLILLCLVSSRGTSATPLDEHNSSWEGEAENVTTTNCKDHESPCADGNGCVYHDFRCDGFRDCGDGSDENSELCKDNCLDISSRFQCADQTCIRTGGVCNGISQCPDGSDEDLKLCESDAFKIKCTGSSQCIDKDSMCDSELDCGSDNPSDEDPAICNDNCGEMEERFQCSNKKCIYAEKVCNGIRDCEDGSDEGAEVCANCNGDLEKFKCAKTSKCIWKTDVCDGWNHCSYRDASGTRVKDTSDEENCDYK